MGASMDVPILKQGPYLIRDDPVGVRPMRICCVLRDTIVQDVGVHRAKG
jgi:hypothetical protein